MTISPYLKAITAALITGLGGLQLAYIDGRVTTQEWVGIAVATAVALGATWGIPNAPKPPKA